MAGLKLEERWTATKALYEETVGKKKPPKTFLVFFHKSSTDLASSFKKFDDAKKQADEGPQPSALKALEGAAEKAQKAIASYLKDLEVRSKKDGSDDPAYTHGLQVLRKDLLAIASLITEAAKNAKVDANLQNVDIGNTSHEKFTALMDDRVAKQFAHGVPAALRNLEAAIAKVQAKPDAQTYQALIPDAIRDLTVWIVDSNLRKIGRGDLLTNDYPKKSIDGLHDIQVAPKQPQSETDVRAYLNAVAGALRTTANWYARAAR